MSNDVFAARQYAQDLQSAVGQEMFYGYMDFILESQAWVSYVDAINGKTRSFSSMEDFLTHRDGLDIRDLDAFLNCLRAVAVSDCRAADNAHDLLMELQLAGLQIDPVPMIRRLISRLRDAERERLLASEDSEPTDAERDAEEAREATWKVGFTTPITRIPRKASLRPSARDHVLAFFDRDKARDRGVRYLTALRKVLQQVPECDWGEAYERPRKAKSDTANPTIFSSKQLVAEHLRPLLAALTEARDELQSLVEQIDADGDRHD